jgi:hypothetical protein
MKDSSSSSTPRISSSKKGTVGQDTNKYRNLFFDFVVPPGRRRRKKEKPRIFRGFLNDFFSLSTGSSFR